MDDMVETECAAQLLAIVTVLVVQKMSSQLATVSVPRLTKQEIVDLRNKHLSPSLSLSYSSTIPNGLHIIRGDGQYLFDSEDNKYLDCRNNVQHIGHSNKILTKCISKQVSLLNTNTRYLHENIVIYASKLTKLLPSPLNYATFVNSGSEANEFALRVSTSIQPK